MRRCTPFLLIAAVALAACGESPTGPGGTEELTFLTGSAAGTPGWLLDDSLGVRVTDRGNPVANTWVRWSADADAAFFSDDSTRTDANGIARVEFAPGWALGTQQVTAAVGQQSAVLDVEVTGMSLTHAEIFDRRVCGLDTDGRMWCWPMFANETHPKRLDDARRPLPVETPLRFTSLAANPDAPINDPDRLNLCAVSTAGELWCAGEQDFSGPHYTASAVPTLHRVTTPAPVASISIGENRGSNRCMVSTDGRAWCAGNNGSGQLGNGTTAPSEGWQEVIGDLRFSTVVVGFLDACGLTFTDEPYCWGQDLGAYVAGTPSGPVTVPTKLAGDLRLKQIAPAANAYCGLTGGSRLLCWGPTFPADRLQSSVPSGLVGIPATASSLAGDQGGGRVIHDGLLYRFGYDGSCCDYQYYGNNMVQKEITGAVRLLSPSSWYWCIEHEAGATVCSYRDERPVAVPLPD